MEVIDKLEQCGKKLGFKTEREWQTSIGRIDLVWYLEFHTGVPGLDNRLPIVAFEIETSW